MASELHVETYPDATVYFQVRSAAGTIWNTVGAALEAYATANIADYDIAGTEQGTSSGYYVGSMPSVAAGIYSIVAKIRLGATPAETDPTVEVYTVNWTGTALAPLYEITAARMGALTDWIDGQRLDLILDIIAADTTTDIPALIAALSGATMTYAHPIAEPIACVSEGSITVSNTALGLPAALFEKAKGGLLDVLLGVDTDAIYLALSGADATSAAMKYAAGSKVLITGMADCKRLSMIRVTGDSTVRYQAFTKSL